jgi:hypothetical protein
LEKIGVLDGYDDFDGDTKRRIVEHDFKIVNQQFSNSQQN